MYFDKQELQFNATTDKPDTIYAGKLQEVLDGQYGEITVTLQYAFPGWDQAPAGRVARPGPGQAAPGVTATVPVRRKAT